MSLSVASNIYMSNIFPDSRVISRLKREGKEGVYRFSDKIHEYF